MSSLADAFPAGNEQNGKLFEATFVPPLLVSRPRFALSVVLLVLILIQRPS